MKSASTMVMAALLALVVLVLVVPSVTAARPKCARVSSSPTHYDCWDQVDHDRLTFQKFDCKQNRGAGTMDGCLDICTPHPNCFGVVFIPNPYGWLGGKYCCFLKTWGMRCSWMKRQYNRITCRWLFSGPSGDSETADVATGTPPTKTTTLTP